MEEKLTMKQVGYAEMLFVAMVIFLTFSTNAFCDDSLYIDENGNVGIGGIPEYQLELYKATGNTSLTMTNATTYRAGFELDGPVFRIGDRWSENGNCAIAFHTAGTEKVKIDTDGRFGIGISGPQTLFHLSGNSTSADIDLAIFESGPLSGDMELRIGYDSNRSKIKLQSQTGGGAAMPLLLNSDGGSVGIGTSSPSSYYKLHIYGNTTGAFCGQLISNANGATGDSARLVFGTYGPNPNGETAIIEAINEDGTAKTALAFRTHTGGSLPEVMRITSGGKVGIGKSSPSYELDVAGTVSANSIRCNGTPWCDYVFEDSYELQPLEDVESFIKKNKHLPEIPSESEVRKNGIDMTDMLTKQMKKIEELTLYMIQMKKENETLKARLSVLENEGKEI